MSGRQRLGDEPSPSASRAMGPRDSIPSAVCLPLERREIPQALINVGVFLIFPVAALVISFRLLLLFCLGH